MEDELLAGRMVTLRPAKAEDKRSIYRWLACSDLSAMMSGPPVYPERPVPTWEEFCADYAQHYFDDSAPLLGRCFVIVVDGADVGQINYNDIEELHGSRRVELDIWLRSQADCGKGYGPDALRTLCRYLSDRFGVREFMVQPSARNPTAIHAYEKAGFTRLPLSPESARAEWGPLDYVDSVIMVKRV